MKTKRMGKILGLLMLLVFMVAGLKTEVFAQENIGVNIEPPMLPDRDEENSVYSIFLPSRDNVYTNNQSKEIAGSASISTLYTNKCFYNVVAISVTITNNHSNKDLKVTLYKYTESTGTSKAKVTAVTTIPVGKSYYINYEGLSKDTYYFLGFGSPSDFKGYVIGWK